MTEAVLAGLVGSVISLLFRYFPGLESAYEGLGTSVKQLIMAVVLFIVAGVVLALNCSGWLAKINPDIVFQCTESGLIDYFKILVNMIALNQATYQLIKK